ncbi:TerD family protein [Streptomyces stelliscabiei]|uniref:TerD family protein n=1 Tax=Streptomyces stelliscabiei TaxID=146820 RepID=UPI0029BF5B55|nr:TerD family protein [Streptomyces stelliscabiei]MDX2553064.1 TerD family protein [Streptomyces stelliscabiei]MDX2612052.1 TerD family protein [Streptomyces stelliscabiei]MDX2636390.1 TerD family protein [Streptomyces stelliscabiei]MDX2663141.1 TerD family protein [Streptomyces stelliscabiei]MDX2714236.1 TerD family protein [Streptomyces stelliscabiei]
MTQSLASLVIRHTHRVPAPDGSAGDGAAAARQFDAVLMDVGFKLSAELLERLSGLSGAAVLHTARRTLRTVREMVGDHVRHNSYFIDFPANVPDTEEFWTRCVVRALGDEKSRESVLTQLANGVLDLLSLPTYGRYQHSYEEMLAAQDELVAAAGDRVTVLHAGRDLDAELTDLYLALAGSTTPLGEEHLGDLALLAGRCALGPQPERIPVRENRAVVNEARLGAGADLLLDTVTDVLRLACALSGGDVTLQEPTRFRALSRPARRALLAGLDAVVAANPAKLADVHAHREPFKRLGERLHPHEYPRWPHAADVFAVARGEKEARSFGSRAEQLLGAGDVPGAVKLLESAPGRLFRALDLLLRAAADQTERDAVVAAAVRGAPAVSGRVVLSVREHFHNRERESEKPRIFVNRRGRAWVTPDRRPPVPAADRDRLIAALDAEIRRRLPAPGRLLVDPDILDVALPLSGRATSAGLGVLPRGSVSAVEGELLRFFVYWKETERRTDYDLSALLLRSDYDVDEWLSYTSLTAVGGEHSGDVTEAPEGASEFINLSLDRVRAAYVVPQVNIYAGEGFEEVEESFFGFMLRDGEQKGRPFEPRTVRMKSELRGVGRVALPLVFRRGDDGRWGAKWLHLYLKGISEANRVEENQVSVSKVVRAVVEREQLTVGYLIDLMSDGDTVMDLWDGRSVPEEPVTYLGLERPEGLHPDSRVVTLGNLRDLIPG